MKIIRASAFWWFGFTLMFFLSLDFWSWERPISLSWLNLPPWVFYFIGLQTIFALALAIFAWQFWQLPRDEGQRR